MSKFETNNIGNNLIKVNGNIFLVEIIIKKELLFCGSNRIRTCDPLLVRQVL